MTRSRIGWFGVKRASALTSIANSVAAPTGVAEVDAELGNDLRLALLALRYVVFGTHTYLY